MTSGHKTVTVLLTLICGLITTIVGLYAHWDAWLWPALGAGLAVGAAVIGKATARPRPLIPSENTLFPDLPVEPPVRQEQRVTGVTLPSAVPDYDFLFSATVRWVPLDDADRAPQFNPGGLAVEAVLLRAREVTARHEPGRSTLVQHRLNGALGSMEPDPSGRVLAMAGDVSLALHETDQQRLRKLSNVRKDEEVWEHERNYERSKRSYLGDDVLKDPGSAVVWWLSRNEEQVERAVERIGLLARLSAAANNAEVAPPFLRLAWPAAPGEAFAGEVPEPNEDGTDTVFGDAATTASEEFADALLGLLGFEPGDPELSLLACRVADVFRAAGRYDEADDLVRRFTPRPDTAPEAEAGDAEDREDGTEGPPPRSG